MIYGIFQTKGGVGKTTTAIVLAELLQDILLIDASQDSNLTAYYQVPAGIRKNNIYSLLFEKKKSEDCIYKLENKSIIPASIKTADDYLFKGLKLSKKLALPYQNIIIDTQPSFGNFNRACIEFSDIAIIPVDMDLWAAESALILNNNILQVKKEIKTYLLPTKTRRNKITKEVLKFISDKNINVLPGISYNSKASDISLHGKLENKRLLRDYKKVLEFLK